MSSSGSSSISNATSSTTSTFVTSLVFNAAVFGIEIAVFTAVRPYFPAIYQPRTYVPAEDKRSKPIGQKLWAWPLALWKADYRDIKEQNGMDAYFFVRFLRMMVRVLLPIWLISWVVLMPVTSVGIVNGTGLNQFNFGNVGVNQQGRYAAHVVLAWIFTIWIWYNIQREMSHFVTARQRWLISPGHAQSAQACTILVTGVPQRYLSEAALTRLFYNMPGGVRQVWVNRDLKDMPDLNSRRLNACKQLESGETSLIHTATKRHNKQLKKDAKAAKKAGHKEQDFSNNMDARPLTRGSVPDTEPGDVSIVDQLVPRKKRPTHRLPLLSFLPSLPLIGKKVDTIDWAREEIETTSVALRDARRILARDIQVMSNSPEADDDDLSNDPPQTFPPYNSAFILFNKQIAAHLAAQSLTHHGPYRMAFKEIGVAPDDIIWGNLNMNPYERSIRTAISWGLTLGLIILWAVPVAFVGVVSNIHSLCATYSWLAWLCKLPSVIVGILTGILPPVLLAVLMMLLPIVLRLMSRFEGTSQRTGVELSLMHRYFLFLVIHSFLIVTVASGLIAALPSLVKDPTSVASILAENLPKASTFFLTYIILQGLSGTASGFLQIVALVIYYVKLYILGSTPRSVYNIKYTLRSVNWGTLFPSTTLLVIITLSYSVISPVINGLACVTFFLFYFLYKYLFLYQFDQPRASETGGLFFPIAMQHIFIGLYIEQVCLAGLFFLAQDANKKASAIPEGALMIVLIIFTAFFHIILNNSFGPLIKYLPLTLAEQASGVTDAVTKRELEDNASVHSVNAGKASEKRKSISNDSSEDTPSPQARTVDEAERGEAVPHTADGLSATGVNVEDSLKGVDEGSGPKDFFHPASVQPQQIVWIPQDTLGVGEIEERANRERGILVSRRDARMDEKGHVDINGAPPQEL